MTSAQKIYAIAAVLSLAGLGIFLPGGKSKAVPADAASAASSDIPNVTLARGDAEKITKIELTRADIDEESGARAITLEKEGDDWEVTSPLRTLASSSKVKALLDN